MCVLILYLSAAGNSPLFLLPMNMCLLSLKQYSWHRHSFQLKTSACIYCGVLVDRGCTLWNRCVYMYYENGAISNLHFVLCCCIWNKQFCCSCNVHQHCQILTGVKSLYYSCVDYVAEKYWHYYPLLQLLPPRIQSNICQERDKRANRVHHIVAGHNYITRFTVINFE